MFRLCFKCNRIKNWLRFVDYAFTPGQRIYGCPRDTRLCNTCFEGLMREGGSKFRDEYMQKHSKEIIY